MVTELELMLNQLGFFFLLLRNSLISNLVDLTRLKRTGLMPRQGGVATSGSVEGFQGPLQLDQHVDFPVFRENGGRNERPSDQNVNKIGPFRQLKAAT